MTDRWLEGRGYLSSSPGQRGALEEEVREAGRLCEPPSDCHCLCHQVADQWQQISGQIDWQEFIIADP